jgi:two-component system, cell cycle sensor histidine kinase and response regulator CckA
MPVEYRPRGSGLGWKSEPSEYDGAQRNRVGSRIHEGNPLSDQAHILIAEDSPTQAAMFRYLLEEHGYRVTVASSGLEALQAARVDHPVMIISDIIMPEMDGYALCRQVKQDPSLSNIPVMLMTSLSSPDDIFNGLDCGADNFLRKPIDSGYLLARVGYILSNRKQRANARTGVEMELVLRDKRYKITSERQQILDLLVSTYEDAVSLNHELEKKQQELAALTAELEERVKARTADLAAEVAERKTAEAKYRGLLEAAPDAIVGVNSERTILVANAQTEAQFGHNREDLLGQKLELLFPGLEHEAVRSLCRGYLDSSASLSRGPVPLQGRRRDNSEFPVEVAFSPLATPTGPVLICIIRDVSEREKLERQLRQSQRLEALGSLAGGVAHDFNNLLGVIMGHGQLLSERLRDGDPLTKHVGAIGKAAKSAAHLTRQLLAFSRQQHTEPIILNLNHTVREISSMLQRVIGDSITLTLELDPQLAQVKADAGQMEQILVNLVVNARDAMADGGKLSISTSNVELDSAYLSSQGIVTKPGSYVMLAVSDTGTGMDSETQARIFEPFFTTKEVGKGTGLGLSTVYGIVNQHAGYIWLYSEIGKGTTFKVYLPSSSEAPEPISAARPVPAVAADQTVLVVEDSEPILELACEFLTKAGYTVMQASSGEEAIRLMESGSCPIDVLVTDISMPGMSGPELAAQLSSRMANLRVVYTSGFAADKVLSQIARGPGSAFLQKPYAKEDLICKVQEVMEAIPG